MPKQASNSSSGSGILIFQKSLKALVQTKSPEAVADLTVFKENEVRDKEKEIRDETTSDTATNNIKDMSQRHEKPSRRRGGHRSRKFEAGADRQPGTRQLETKEPASGHSETQESGSRPVGCGEPEMRESVTRKAGPREPDIRESGARQHRNGESRSRHHGTREAGIRDSGIRQHGRGDRRDRRGFRALGIRQHGTVRPGTGQDHFQSRNKETSANDSQNLGSASTDVKSSNCNKEGQCANGNQEQSQEEDWSKDFINVDKSVEMEDGKSSVGRKNADQMEQSSDDQDKRKVSNLNKNLQEEDLNNACGKTSCETAKALQPQAGGPLQSTPKKKQEGNTFEKCAFDLSDTEVVEVTENKHTERHEMRPKLGNVSSQQTKQETVKTSDMVKSETFCRRSKYDWDRNRNNISFDRSSVGSFDRNTKLGSRPVVHGGRSAVDHAHDRRDFRFRAHRQFDPPPLPPRLRRKSREEYRDDFQNANNIARSAPTIEKHTSHTTKLERSSNEDIASKCSSDVVGHGWEVPCSEDWMSEADEKDHLLKLGDGLVGEEDSEVHIQNNDALNSNLTFHNQVNPAYDAEDVSACIGDVQEKLKAVCVTDKPYLPPPPPLEEESSNTTTESMYNTARESMENTDSPESKETSMLETSCNAQGEKNAHVPRCENDEGMYMTGSHAESEKAACESTIDEAGNQVLASMYEEQTKLDETDSYPVMDCSESEIYQSGMASQENTDIDFTSFQEFEKKPSGLLEPEFTHDSPVMKDEEEFPAEHGGGMSEPEDTQPCGDDYMLYREWYQKRFFEWYSRYDIRQHGNSNWSGPGPNGGTRAGEGFANHPTPWSMSLAPTRVAGSPSHPGGCEGQPPWYPQGRVSDFWRDRMPYWVDSQKETAKNSHNLSHHVGDTKQELTQVQSGSNTDSNVIAERRFNTVKDNVEDSSGGDGNKKFSTCKDSAKYVVNQANDVDSQERTNQADRSNQAERINQTDRTSQAERTNQAEQTRLHRRASTDDENTRQESPIKAGCQCVCGEDQVRYLVWRMCRCPAGTPPRLQQVYHRGGGGRHEDWSLDLGYQSYDSIEDQCQNHRSAGQLFYGPPTSTSPDNLKQGEKGLIPTDPSCPRLPLKPSLSQRVLQGPGPGPPPGFQPLVYTLTTDNRPAGRGRPISMQQTGTVRQLDNRHVLAARQPLDNDNIQPHSKPQSSNCGELNNNATYDSLVTNLPASVQGPSDLNNNNPPQKLPASTNLEAGGEPSRPGGSRKYLPNGEMIPESLSNSAAHLAQASASLHKAGLSNMKLNSVLHTFSEAIVAIGKTLQGDEEDETASQTPSEQVGNVGVIGDGRQGALKHSNDSGQCDGKPSRARPAYGRSCSDDPRQFSGLPGDHLERADSSPGCFDARNVSERSSICDADNESDGAAEEEIMEHQMMMPAMANLECSTALSKDRAVEHSRMTRDSGPGVLDHPMMSQAEAGFMEHPMMGQQPGLSWYQDIDDMFSRVTQQQLAEANMNNASHTRPDQPPTQQSQPGRAPGQYLRPPSSFIGPCIPADFRPHSHFMNGPPMPRFSPSPGGRISPTQDPSRGARFSPKPDGRQSPSPDQRMFNPHSYRGQRMRASRWGTVWEQPNCGPPCNQGNRQPSPASSQECKNPGPPGWRVNPLPARPDRRQSDVSCGSEQAPTTQQTPVKGDQSVTGDSRCSASYCEERSQDRRVVKQACQLVDYGFGEESDDEDQPRYGGATITVENRSVTQPTAVTQFTPKKFCADLSQNFTPSSDDDVANIPLPASAPPAVGARSSRHPLKQKVLKSMSTSTKSSAPKVLFPENKPQSDPHSGKKRTFAEILAASNAHKRGYSGGNLNPEDDATETTKPSPKKLSPLLAMPDQQQDLPPLPPLPPFPSSPFWGMYMPASNSALTGKEVEEKSYSEAARAGAGQWRNRDIQQQQVANKNYSRRSWPISSAGRFTYTPSSESDNDSRSGTLQDWRRSFKQFHNFGVKYIDTHCHLDFLFSREGYHGSFSNYMVKHAETFPDMFEGCVAVFCNPQSFRPNEGLWLEVAKEPNVWLAMGCHPKMATDFTEAAEAGLRRCLTHKKCIALGEIGLDYSGIFYKHEMVQKRVFRRQLAIALEMNKPLVIHSRDAEDDCLAILKEMVPRDYKIHCHCFTAYYSNAQLWLDAFPNLYIGLTPLVTYRTASPTHDTATKIPLNRLLLETDAPYFIPRCIPKTDLPLSNPGLAITVAKEVAQYQEMPVAAVLRQCRLNTKFMYGI